MGYYLQPRAAANPSKRPAVLLPESLPISPAPLAPPQRRRRPPCAPRPPDPGTRPRLHASPPARRRRRLVLPHPPCGCRSTQSPILLAPSTVHRRLPPTPPHRRRRSSLRGYPPDHDRLLPGEGFLHQSLGLACTGEEMAAAARPRWSPTARPANERLGTRVFASPQKQPSRGLAAQAAVNSRINRWRFCMGAVALDDYLPMRSTEVKNRASSSDIKSLRLITKIKTPYLPDGRFDLEAYDSLINMQIDGGTEGVIVGGTTGEGQLMSWDEHIMLIGHTVNCFGTKIKVIGNTGRNSTREAVHATEQGFAVGMHAALHINPKTSIEGLISHFEAVLPMGPTIICNVPFRTGQDIPPAVIETISGFSNLVGVKECVGHERVQCYTDKGIAVWSGNDDECHDSRWKYGATGVISVASNLVPGLMHDLMYQGENVTQNAKLLPLMKWLFCERYPISFETALAQFGVAAPDLRLTYIPLEKKMLFCEPHPIALNTALAQLGVVRPVFRSPHVPLPPKKRVEFVRIVEEIGRENFVGQKEVRALDDDDFVLISRY